MLDLDIIDKVFKGFASLREPRYNLHSIKSKLELDNAVSSIIKNNHCVLNSDSLYVLREKIYTLLLQNNDIPEDYFVFLYKEYLQKDIKEDEKFAPYFQYINDNYNSKNVDIKDKAFFAKLEFVLNIVNGKCQKGAEEFFFKISTLNLYEILPLFLNELTKKFIDFCNVDINILFCAQKRLLDKKYYFALSQNEQRSIFNWNLHYFWNTQKYFNHPIWMELYPIWKEIFYEHLERRQLDMAMYIQFYIHHKMGNNFTTQEQWATFNKDISKRAVFYYQEYAKNNNLKAYSENINGAGNHHASNKKKKIGFLKDRVVRNSVYKIEFSLIKTLMDDKNFAKKYEIYFYLMEYIEKSSDDLTLLNEYQNLGVIIRNPAKKEVLKHKLYHSHLQKVLLIRDGIINDGIDILISPNNGFDISDFILCNKSAKKQLFFSHGNYAYDIDGIDKRLTHAIKQDEILQGFAFSKIDIAIAKEINNPPKNKQIIANERLKYPKDAVVLGSIGRLIKASDYDYLSIVADILKDNPKTIYILAGHGNYEEIQEKVNTLGIQDKFYMSGFVDPHIYGHIIDIYLNTFPLGGGESVVEFNAKNKICINLHKSSLYFAYNNLTSAQKNTYKKYKDILKDKIVFSDVHFAFLDNAYLQKIIDFSLDIPHSLTITNKKENVINDNVVYIDTNDKKVLSCLCNYAFLQENNCVFFKGNCTLEKAKDIDFMLFEKHNIKFLDENLYDCILKNKNITLDKNNSLLFNQSEAFNINEYKQKASKFINDKEYYNKVSISQKAILDCVYKKKSLNTIKDFKSILGS